MTKRKDPPQDKAALLALVPHGHARVGVLDELGKERWRELDAVAATDVIRTRADGTLYTMRSTPGRKQIPDIVPANAVVAELQKRKREFIDHDPVLKAVKRAPESTDVLHQVMLALAEEASSLAFERTEAERRGEETSAISIRHVNALKAQVDTWLKRKDQLGSKSMDLESPAYEAVFQWTIDTFCTAMRESNMRPEAVEAVKSKFVKKINDEWMVEAKRRIKDAG